MEQRLFQSQKMEAIGTLAGGIAHDFNNILSAVIGYTELLQMNLPANSEEFDYARQIKQAGNRAKDLVQQILTFSRQTEQELKPVEVSTIVKEVIKLLRSSLPTTIEIKHNIQGSSLVMGDSTQLHQILMNLCANAGHAMQEKGGLLTIALQSIDLRTDLMSDQVRLSPGAYVQLTVSDTGHGIPNEYLDRVFDPFFSTKERGEGTGMGLSVVHGIVQSYHGAIHVYSEEGTGSTFKIFLPAIERRTEPEKRQTDDIQRGTGHILFVDDEPILVKMSTSQLETLGYTVSSRTNSLEALALFKKNPGRFDLVITDMTMPKMTGDELAREIKRIRHDIPVILCTGFSSKITPENVHQFDIDAFLMKPIIIQDMAKVVREVMEKNSTMS
jgi:CheY-like chemotaxis protein